METKFNLHLLQLLFIYIAGYACAKYFLMSMKHLAPKRFFLFLFIFLLQQSNMCAQQVDCKLNNPVITIDFGDDSKPQNFQLTQLKEYYRSTQKQCPDDGEFSFVSFTNRCFNGNWIEMGKDHTPGSVNGRMMLVNAAYDPAAFFSITLTKLKPNTTYELSAWFVNVCLGTEGCVPTPPEIKMSFFAGAQRLSSVYTGSIPPTSPASWRRLAGTFTTPASFPAITLVMNDLIAGGCGNDFAMDDIEVRECVVINPPPPVVVKPLPAPVVAKPVVKNIPAKPLPKPASKTPTDNPSIKTKQTAVVSKLPVSKQETNQPVIKAVASPLPVPEIIKARATNIAGTIETPESEILIELYDNGEIDGDTVTIYHNNKMVVAHAGLSIKPVSFKIKVDKNDPYHELVMVADNLGSIPPNTSLMVVTSKYKRHEVFISSSEQKNAKLVLKLVEE